MIATASEASSHWCVVTNPSYFTEEICCFFNAQQSSRVVVLLFLEVSLWSLHDFTICGSLLNHGFSIFLLSNISRGLSVIHQGLSKEGTLPLSLACHQFSNAFLFRFNLHTLLCWPRTWRMWLVIVVGWFCRHYTITKVSVFCEIILHLKKLYRLALPTHHPQSQLQHYMWKQIWSPPILSKEFRNGWGDFFHFFTTMSSSLKSSHTCSRSEALRFLFIEFLVCCRWLDALWKCAITDVSGTSALPIHPSFLCLRDGAPPPPVVPAHWFQGLQKGAPHALILYMGAEKHFYPTLCPANQGVCHQHVLIEPS